LSDVDDKLKSVLPPDGMLKREHFTADRVRAYAELAAKAGLALPISEEAREASRKEVEAAVPPGADVWVFGYGSLMWNPAINFVESRKAEIRGYHRCFCLTLGLGRGSPDKPGLMLGLDRGGACVGVAHRIAAKDVASELTILWYREMLSGAYHPRWLGANIDGLGTTKVLAFVINRANPRYEARVPEDAAARRIAAAEGLLGTNRDYLYRTARRLRELGIADGPMHRLERRVRALAGEPDNVNVTEGDRNENRIV
jgi:glutathione-specific gamma-glutamylcyclotransferase